MIFAGTSSDNSAPDQRTASTTAINNGQLYDFNTKNDNNMYVGFEYVNGIRNGHANNTGGGRAIKSNALTELNKWFADNLSDEFNGGVNTKIDTNAGFCGDRSSYSGTNENTRNDELGVSKQETYYGAYIRNFNNPAYPTYKCGDPNDLYTYTGSSKGTKSLEYPIGLISVDEVTYAGGSYDKKNQSYYLYSKLENYWTMSPMYYRSGAVISYVSENLWRDFVMNERSLRPVINLKSGSLVSGDGTVDNPFTTIK